MNTIKKFKISLKSKILSMDINNSHIDMINFFDDNKMDKQSIDNIDLTKFIGPIENSNWIIKNKLLVGKYPFDELNKLIDVGVNTFISLQPIDELNSLNTYKVYLKDNHKFYNYPIPDRSIIDDNITINYVKEIIELIKLPHTYIYIHCMGGHGRTGVIVALLLGIIYKMNDHDALKLTKKLHDARWIFSPPIKNIGKKSVAYKYLSPQTTNQIKQVKRLLSS